MDPPLNRAPIGATLGATFAIAVRDGADLFLVLRIHRGPKGDVYVNWPRDDPKWNPHASLHASGQHHQKSNNYIMAMALDHRQKPDACFRGTQRVAGMPISSDEPRLINRPYQRKDFDGVLEIPVSEVRSEKYLTTRTVDAVESNRVADIIRERRIVRQAVFKDATPWIVATLWET